MPITRYWSIALSSSVSFITSLFRSSVAIPRNTNYKTLEGQTNTKYKVCSKSLFHLAHVAHINISSGFCVHWTCECQREPCCQNSVHTGGMWDPQGEQSVPKYGSWQCPRIPWFSGKVYISKFLHWPPTHCQGPVHQQSLPWSQPRLKYMSLN